MKQQGRAYKKTILVVVSACGLVVILLFFWLLSFPKPWNPYNLQEGIPDSLLSDGVTIKLEKTVYPSAILEIKMSVNNHNYQEVTSGIGCRIEVLIEGKWYEIPVIDDGFQALAFILEPNKPWETSDEIFQHFGKLPKGHYRCMKNIFQEKTWTTYASAEFDVT